MGFLSKTLGSFPFPGQKRTVRIRAAGSRRTASSRRAPQGSEPKSSICCQESFSPRADHEYAKQPTRIRDADERIRVPNRDRLSSPLSRRLAVVEEARLSRAFHHVVPKVGCILVGCLLLRVGLPAAEVSNANGMSTPNGRPVTCVNCHTSADPTKEDVGLLPCPRSSTGKGPDVVLLDQLSQQYVPVVFAHRLHAEMTEMTGGCALCHHHNPTEAILPCRECHGFPTVTASLRYPGLKGAYHRQCLNCHREWSHETECSVCHAKKTADSLPVHLPDPTDIMGILHPNVEEPDTVRYQIDCEEGSLVTFRHEQHAHRFGLKCVRCHQEENCSRCHSSDQQRLGSRTAEELHLACSGCHDTSEPEEATREAVRACRHCHAEEETPPFEHASTGLILNEDHQDWDCIECHLEGRYDRPASCSGCHEAEIHYPEKSPGTPIELP